ncbi:tetratricopeptide repeat protein [Chromobacterium vaccinii]|uniref:tetratricopeptide repeat protein n=1 Tax=Chromobacterium vaccinii TaxID=1108595 RepID=UPI0009E54E2A|nr:tetratricopeptide repeat protein [Chromobacterium vaccinii]
MNLLTRIFRFLIGGKQFSPKTSVKESAGLSHKKSHFELSNGWLTLIDPDFFGKTYLSPNQKLCVACSDYDGAGTGGFREKGYGRVILFDCLADKIIHELSHIARPVDSAVADNGAYIVHDSGFGSELQGDLIAVGRDGCEIYRRHYTSNIHNIGLSNCGRYAAVQTCNAPGEDGNHLEVLDLNRRCSIFFVQPVTGWADKYIFEVDADGELEAFFVEHEQLGTFRYARDGMFLDVEQFLDAQLQKGNFSTKISAARELLKKDPTPANAKKALNAADAALAEGAGERSDWGAIAHRVRGEAYDLLSHFPEALNAYEKALALNSKVGVQKRAAALRKKLDASGAV